MRRLIFTLFAFTLTVSVLAQNKKKEKTSGPWKQGGMISVVGGQGGSRNWAAGSERFSFSFAAYLNLYANRTWGKNLWENSANIGYAMVNTSSQGVRKQDDKLDIYAKYGYLFSGKERKKEWRFGFVANLRTQLTESFDYEQAGPKVIGRFFAPAYLTFAPGFNVKACEGLNLFVSPVAARWVVATNQPYSLVYQGGVKPDGSSERAPSSLYGVNPQSKVRFEAGPYVSVQYHKNVAKNVKWSGRFDALSDFADGTPQNVDVYWTNTIGMKVNNWLQVTYNFDIIYDNDVKMFGPLKTSPATQLRSMLGVGLMAKF
jgi:hypothetical protein